MGLLQDIIDGATGESRRVSELLRSAQVLAHRTKAVDLSEWVTKERDGYSEDDTLPAYRGPFDARVLAHFSGPFGSEVRDLAIGPSGFPDYYRSPGFTVEFRQAIIEIEDLLSTGGPYFSVPWSGDMIAAANGLIQKGEVSLVPMHGIASADKRIPRSQLVGIVDRVRGRILDLSLELEDRDPELGSQRLRDGEVVKEEVSAVFQTVIHANQAFVGENRADIKSISVTPGDPESLRRYLQGLGVSEAASAELTQAAQESNTSSEEPSKLRSIIGRVASEAGKLAPDVAKALIDAAIAKWTGSA